MLSTTQHGTNTEGLTRREFLATTLGLGGCAYAVTLKPGEPYDPIKFDMWFRANKLYNGPNPNLRWPHAPTPYTHGLYAATFRETLEKKVSPGRTYSVLAGQVMVAVAPGVIWDFGTITGTGRAGGQYVQMVHPGMGLYSSNFSHVGELLCDPSKPIRRGQPICKVPMQYSEFAKLMFWDNGFFADPDNYGPKHGYMEYYKGFQGEPINFSREEVVSRWDAQKGIVAKLRSMRRHRLQDPLVEKLHNPGGYKVTTLTHVELFRYLSTMYEMFPQEFPDLNREVYEKLEKEFYASQPITITLPFLKRRIQVLSVR